MQILEHLYIDHRSRELIAQATDNAQRVYLAPLDKGLSGAQVWLAQWDLDIYSKRKSKLHVFKIHTDDKKKLIREKDAIDKIAAVIDSHFPHHKLYTLGRKKGALLRQQFLGRSPKEINSLRQYINKVGNENQVIAIIDNLYKNRMRDWHSNDLYRETRPVKLVDALDWWVSRMNLDTVAENLGLVELNKMLYDKFQLDIQDIKEKTHEIGNLEEEIEIGPVHGDLHSQNVLVSSSNSIQLIDYGWTGLKWRAVDFLMLECSLKFLVTPVHARIDDLLEIEYALDKSGRNNLALGHLKELVYGQELCKIAHGVNKIRQLALELQAVENWEQYRRGLIMLTSGLATIPSPMFNKLFLFNSLGYHISKM